MDGQHMRRQYLCDRLTLKRSSRVILGWGEHGTGGIEVIDTSQQPGGSTMTSLTRLAWNACGDDDHLDTIKCLVELVRRVAIYLCRAKRFGAKALQRIT